MKFEKKSAYYANEESFKIYDGSTLLFTSPVFANHENRVIEKCLSSSTNKQYKIELLDSYGDSWTTGSRLTVYGLYGNAVFKNMMTAARTETYTISLYYAIEKNVNWKLTSGTASTGWTAYSFSDSTWTDAQLGSVTTTVSGTQYFRKQFVGLANMAAYDVRLNYKAGVIAYINGAEVYRDNMPSGDVTSSTAASGQYQTIDYRGFIRPGSEVAAQQSILAVELHFVTAETTVYFNAYLALLASTIPDSNCFIYADSVSISSNEGINPSHLFDFGKMSSYYLQNSQLPATVTFTFEGPKPYINTIRVWPYTTVTYAPSNFIFQGSNNNQQWTNAITVSGAVYTSKTYKSFGGYFFSSLYSYYRLSLPASTGTSNVEIYELQPVICTTAMPTSIIFTPNTYTFWARYQRVHVRPDIHEFTQCTAQNLPAGLTIDPTTCVISGIVNTAMSGTSITVSSVIHGNTYTGSFTLNIQECAGTIISVLRTYTSSASYESFEIKDASTQQVVMAVAADSGQVNNEDWTSIACVTGQKYTVSTGSTLNNWQAESHLYVRAVLAGDEMETILRIHYDTRVGFPLSRTFNAQYAVHPHSNWYYKHGVVPTNWYSSTSTSGWTEGNDSNFAESSNQIQLYKKTFTVASINDIAGFVLSIKFKYGCIVYLNGHEAFRKGITDATIAPTSFANNIYTNTLYHQISLPIKTVQVGDTAAVNYIQQGSNTIAIGIVAANANQKEAIFDCALRLMTEQTESRVFDYAVTSNGMNGSPSSILNHHFSYSIYSNSCADNHFTIAFNNDRHEWINSFVIKLHYMQSTEQVHQLVLKARIGNDEWTTLSTVTGLTWSQTGQAHIIYFQNNKAYNEYRFENFASGDTTNCPWKLGTLDLRSVYTTMTVPELAYEALTIFKDIEMGEVYPNSEYYYNFQITPTLPNGIRLDPNTGMISGTARSEMPTTAYSISATKLTGGTSTAVFSFSIQICTEGRSLVTLVAHADYYPEQASYKVYQGIGTSGTVVRSVNQLSVASGLNYGDFCLNDNIYTLQLLDSSLNGWSNPAGYYLTVDLGEMIIEMGQVPGDVASVSTMFSTYLPFQINYSKWKIHYDYVENWMTLDFDDSAWAKKKVSEIGTNIGATTYIRKEVNIPDINNYQVLNIRVKYVGGVVAYFNGRKVARFNLEENFGSDSKSNIVHNQDEFSKFHVIMTTVGGVTGKNIMAFEIHRPTGQSSSSPVVFDATGVFGVNDCSILVDTYSKIDGSTVYFCDIKELLNLNPTTYGHQPNIQGTYLEWTVENMEGTKFNSFGMQTAYDRYSYGFSLYVRRETSEEYTSALALLNQNVKGLERSSWAVPLGIAGFNQLKFLVDDPATYAVYVSSYMLLYCKPSGTGVCPGIGDYPPVGEGEISPSSCEEGYRGYSYRTCSNGQLGDINNQYCTQKLPDKLTYDSTIYNTILGTKVYIAKPTFVNIIEEFYLAENTYLPMGLTLNTNTGEISGVPTEQNALRTFTIYGKNQVGITFATINISVKKGTCKAEGIFPTTEVGNIYVYNCALGGSYVGSQKRACILGEHDGEWQGITGVCMPIAFIVVIVIVAIIIVAVAVFIIVRVNGRAKAVGGVKGKGAKAAGTQKKTLSKTESTKKVVKV